MNKASLVLLLVILAIVVFVVGGAIGILTQKVQVAKANAIIKTLSSKVVPSIVAYGKVSEIKGRNITLTYVDESMVVHVKDNANIVSFTSKTGSTVQKKVDFSDIKKGDNVNINLKMSPTGELTGESVIIIPSFNANAK